MALNPQFTAIEGEGWVGWGAATAQGGNGDNDGFVLVASSKGIDGRGLQSFTLELNLSNSRTRS